MNGEGVLSLASSQDVEHLVYTVENQRVGVGSRTLAEMVRGYASLREDTEQYAASLRRLLGFRGVIVRGGGDGDEFWVPTTHARTWIEGQELLNALWHQVTGSAPPGFCYDRPDYA